MNSENIIIYGVGDVTPDRPNPESLFDLALPALKKADILFGQLEDVLASKGTPQQAHRGHQVRPERVSGLTHAGFDVLSFASNTTMDFGEDALLETIDNLTKSNIAVIGVGRDIEEARKPAILERSGTKIAFLAYCSVLPPGYEAGANKSGAAPLRATTSYEQVDWQAGTPPRIITFANKDDLAAMVDDIRKAKAMADVVVVSMHWGVHFVPAVIAMYQREAAYAAIDAGADVILGHHSHILKGIEVYRGKAIFYGLCNFVKPSSGGKGRVSAVKKLYRIQLDPEYLDYHFPVDSRKSIIASCTIAGKKIQKISYLPLMINKHAQPEVLLRSDKRSAEVFDYMQWCCKDQEIDTKFSRDGDEVVVET